MPKSYFPLFARKVSFGLIFVFLLILTFIGSPSKSKAYVDHQSFQATADATVYSNAASQNYGNYTYLETSYATGPVRQEMIYLKFDVSQLPPNATITDAKMLLTLKSCNGILSTNKMYFGKVNGTWTESGINWSNRPNYSGSYDTSASCEQDKFVFYVTDAVTDWYNGTSPNYGIAVYGPKSGIWERNFYSKEYSGTLDRPALIVTYTLPNNEEPPANDPDSGDDGSSLPDDDQTGISNPPVAPSPSTPSTSAPAETDENVTVPEDYDLTSDDSNGIAGSALLTPITGSIFNLLLCICCSCSCLGLVVLFIYIILKKKGKKEVPQGETTKVATTADTKTTPTETTKVKGNN